MRVCLWGARALQPPRPEREESPLLHFTEHMKKEEEEPFCVTSDHPSHPAHIYIFYGSWLSACVCAGAIEQFPEAETHLNPKEVI